MAAIKAINAMGPETINKFMASIELIGHEARNIPDGNNESNKATISTKPSNASAAQESVELDDEIKSIISEDIEKLFEGEDLKEDFKEKVSVLFESAINLKVAKRTLELEEQYNAALDEELNTISENLIEGLNKFCDYSVEKWLEENAVAIESTLKSDLTEQFVEDLHELFKTHYITVPEDRVDVVEELEQRIAELEELASSKIDENIELQAEIEARDAALEESKIEAALETMVKDLPDSDAEKLRTMTESVEYTSVEDFLGKAKVLKESLFPKETTSSRSNLFEETEVIAEAEETRRPRTAMDVYAAVLDKSA